MDRDFFVLLFYRRRKSVSFKCVVVLFFQFFTHCAISSKKFHPISNISSFGLIKICTSIYSYTYSELWLFLVSYGMPQRPKSTFFKNYFKQNSFICNKSWNLKEYYKIKVWLGLKWFQKTLILLGKQCRSSLIYTFYRF